jgi:transposase-like protein
MAKAKYTKAQFDAEYPDDAACLRAIMEMRYGGTDTQCPHCKKPSKFHLMAKRRGFSCQWCGFHIFPCVGTIFEKSRTPLTKWFYAMYLFTASRHGVPARELERQLGVTYKCAFRIAHRLRKLMAMADYHGPLGGTGKHIEADETWVGGRARDLPHGKGARVNKTIVLGIVERDGPVRAGVIPTDSIVYLEGSITRHVRPGTRISTDDHRSYRHLNAGDFNHDVVKHSLGEYARGDVHTNTIEGYWSRLKNSIKGTHVHVSAKYLNKYVGEFSYRYNMRKQPQEMFNRMILAVSLPTLSDD